MQKRLCLPGLMAGLLIFVLALPCTPIAAQGGEFEEDVARVISSVENAWNERDPEALAAMFTKKADLHSRDDRWFTGPAEIARYFEEWISLSDGDVKDITLDRTRPISESLALVDVVSRLMRDETVTQEVKVAVVVERQLDGSWQFAAWRECEAR